MKPSPPARVSVSTWALHPALGLTYWDTPERPEKIAAETYGPGTITLMDVPARLAALGVRTMELCHFHLASREPVYLADLRAALDAADVRLFSLLIDAGDVTHPEHGARDEDWIAGWIETADTLGAERARVIAGKQPPTTDNLARSRVALTRLAERADACGVRLMTENWFSILSRPEHVHELLGGLDGAVGLCLDFGNWGGPTKYDDLAAIAPRAESCHAKRDFFENGAPDTEDFRRCLDLTRAANFAGPYTLVHAGPGNVWESLARQRDAVLSYAKNPPP